MCSDATAACIVALVGAFASSGCEGTVGDPASNARIDPRDETIPIDTTRPGVVSCDAFRPSSVEVYGSKVKTLLTGTALTGAELESLQTDPTALTTLIDRWTATPRARDKLLRFFSTVFQQEGWEEEGLTIQWDEARANMGNVVGTRTPVFALLRRNFEESFARTALDLVERRRPFNEVVTTRSFMMTTAMMVALAYQDERHTDDRGRSTYRTLATRIPRTTFTTAAISPNATLDPASPSFMRFTASDPRTVPSCAGTEIADATANAPRTAFRAMLGYFTRLGADPCRADSFVRASALLSAADFDDWRLVTVRRPASAEGATQFYELEAIRASDELVVHTPRVGFFTTPAFFATWPTNEDNQARVTTNQTLIVGLGASIDGSETITPVFPDALDGEHADPGTPCYSCHVTLDPMRQFFRRDFTFTYSEQTDSDVRALRAAFAFAGVDATGDDIFEYARTLATHPQLARAWVQKLCSYANSADCPESAELDRIAGAFGSSLDFRALVRDLFSSPLVTSASCIEGGTGDNAAIARARHFCTTLSARLEVDDVCGSEQIPPAGLGRMNAPLVPTIPDDAFSRGNEHPIAISDVSLFVRGTYERVCRNVATQLVGDGKKFEPSAGDGAITAFVEQLMGLAPADPRHDGARAILAEHRATARGEGADATVALQSAFVLACMSPSVVGIGL